MCVLMTLCAGVHKGHRLYINVTLAAFAPSVISMETEYRQASLGSLVCTQDGEPMSCQTPGPVTYQPGTTGVGSDSFPCLRPLTFPQPSNEEARRSGEVTVMVKEKAESGSLSFHQ
ncbi:proline-rich transmembrane 2-like protein [Labeo rohita]|uniref:Proline-rich transmembrane 2-like protein n=1 Tax=Labeo rohita TaxID=84645 RepID=A0A498M426_LABRO|nr:proline-rich transmembrane 2-like protein [Labeo rohita]